MENYSIRLPLIIDVGINRPVHPVFPVNRRQRPGICLLRKCPDDGVIVYARTDAGIGVKQQ
ncbi:hypothetical protein ACGI10_27905, partial [Escherichia coli]